MTNIYDKKQLESIIQNIDTIYLENEDELKSEMPDNIKSLISISNRMYDNFIVFIKQLTCSNPEKYPEIEANIKSSYDSLLFYTTEIRKLNTNLLQDKDSDRNDDLIHITKKVINRNNSVFKIIRDNINI